MPAPTRYCDRIITKVHLGRDEGLGNRGGEYELDYKPVGYGGPIEVGGHMFPFRLVLGSREVMFIFESNGLCKELIRGLFSSDVYRFEELNAIAVDLSTGDLYMAAFVDEDDDERQEYTMSVHCSPLGRAVPKALLPVLGELTHAHHCSITLPAYALNGFISRELGYMDLGALYAVEIDLFGTSLDKSDGDESIEVLEGLDGNGPDTDSDGCRMVIYKNHYLVVSTDLGITSDSNNTVRLTMVEEIREYEERESSGAN